MWNIKVDVTKEHIDNAVQRDSHRCMIADAIHSRLKWATYVQVDTQSIRFNNTKSKKRWMYFTPPEAQKALVLFDQGIKVKPFSFTLNNGLIRKMKARGKKFKRTGKLRKKHDRKSNPILTQFREFGLRKLAR